MPSASQPAGQSGATPPAPAASVKDARSTRPTPALAGGDEAVPLHEVETELCTLAGQIAAATSRFLALLADVDAREGWAGVGVRSCAHWLSWRCGIDLRTAREHVRVARALLPLPQTREAFSQGRVSYSKVRAIARVATPENESDLLTAALHAPTEHVERLTRGLRTALAASEDPSGDRAEVAAERLAVRWRWDEDGSLVVWGRLAAEEGARLLAALTRADGDRRRRSQGSSAPPVRTTCPESRPEPESRPQPEPGGPAGPPGRGSRDAVLAAAPADVRPGLVAMSEMLCAGLDAPVHAPAADVVVHVDLPTLLAATSADTPVPRNRFGKPVLRRRAPSGADPDAGSDAGSAAAPSRPPRPARLDDGPPLAESVLRRLACDGRLQLSVEGPDGRTLDVGRRRRRPTGRQLTALWRRDRGCVVPGCGRTRFLHAHHVVPWARGGGTSLDNLVLLCGDHHRALHEGALGVVALGSRRPRPGGPPPTWWRRTAGWTSRRCRPTGTARHSTCRGRRPPTWRTGWRPRSGQAARRPRPPCAAGR